MTINHFLIDAGNVYLEADHFITDSAVQRIYAKEKTTEEISGIIHGPAEEEFSIGRITGEEYCRRIARQLGVKETEFCKTKIFKSFHNQHITRINDRFMQDLEYIEHTYGAQNIAIVTLTHEWQTERENELLLNSHTPYQTMEERFPERVFRTHLMGKSKKTVEFWKEVFEKTGYVPCKTLLVDDSQGNLDAARKYDPAIQVFKYNELRPFEFSDFLKSRQLNLNKNEW